MLTRPRIVSSFAAVPLAIALIGGSGLPGLGAPAAATPPSPAAALLDDLGPADAVAPIADHVPSADDRYSLAMGCFSLRSDASGDYVVSDGTGWSATASTAGQAEAFLFQPLDLGKYLLFASDGSYLGADPGPLEIADQATQEGVDRSPVRPGDDLTRSYIDDLPGVTTPAGVPVSTYLGGVTVASAPSASTEWIVRDAPGSGLTLLLPVDDGAQDDPGPSDVAGDAPVDGTLTSAADGTMLLLDGQVAGAATVFTAEAATGCAAFPEAQIGITGEHPTGSNPVDEVRGYIDGHLHMMAFEFLGGRARCGRPWHPYGIAYALVDCPDHEPGGMGSVLEAALSGTTSHDTTGWPDFTYWPRYNSLTHEQVYYAWLERAWRGGLRTFTNLLVDNNALCEAWPLKDNSCNEMDGVRLQAQRMRELERYIDAQWGGPGKGWFRIVTDPFEARRTIHDGRLAVVMGIEVSVVFDCGLARDVALCTADDIDRELAAVRDLGVRQMEFVNKFDNALSGVKGDGGSTGVIVNVGNFWDTGSWWRMETCPDDAEGHDHTQYNLTDESGAPEDGFGRDTIFGQMLQLTGASGVAPAYPSGPHCNVQGLSGLGVHLLERMAETGMLFDPDHMSALARHEAMDVMEDLDYTGIISSHSWADDGIYEKVLDQGGIVTPYAGGSTGFLGKWRQTRGWADSRYYFGIGWGADTNGLGSQGGPRNPGPADAVTYPFTGFGGVTVDRQVSGNQTYDINTDGVDHYGLYPDWVRDIEIQAGTDAEAQAFLADMERGPEAYLQVWERALGIANDACRDDRVALPTAEAITNLRVGDRDEAVLVAIGQPNVRANATFVYCSKVGRVTLTFDAGGLLVGDDRGLIDTGSDDEPKKDKKPKKDKGPKGPGTKAAPNDGAVTAVTTDPGPDGGPLLVLGAGAALCVGAVRRWSRMVRRN